MADTFTSTHCFESHDREIAQRNIAGASHALFSDAYAPPAMKRAVADTALPKYLQLPTDGGVASSDALNRFNDWTSELLSHLDGGKAPLLAQAVREQYQGHVAYPDLEITSGIRSLNDANELVSAGSQQMLNMLDGLIEHLSHEGSVSYDLEGLGPTMDSATNNPGEFTAQGLAALDQIIDRLSFPMSQSEIGKVSVKTMPFFAPSGFARVETNATALEAKALSTGEESLSVKSEEVLCQPEKPFNIEVQPATEALIDAIERKGRSVTIASPGSEEMRFLNHLKANGTSLAPEYTQILLKEDAPKVTALEEFLHGTQYKIGLLKDPDFPREIAEIHVKDFMIRHARILGLTENDVCLLDALKQAEIEKARLAGYAWKDK